MYFLFLHLWHCCAPARMKLKKMAQMLQLQRLKKKLQGLVRLLLQTLIKQPKSFKISAKFSYALLAMGVLLSDLFEWL